MYKGNILIEKDGLKYVQFENLKRYDKVITHCFTTRIGGVSTGECSSLNFGFKRKDSSYNVKSNFKLLCDVLSINYQYLVLSDQVHDNKVKIVGKKDRGKGIEKQSDIIGVDALVTSEKQVPIVTFYADCVPVLFFDTKNRIIAAAHSGWRGTVKQVAVETLKVMMEKFGSNPKNIEIVIGPSIGKCCFEVGEEVYLEFITKMNWSQKFCLRKNKDKWYIDLQQIIKTMLMNNGIKSDSILISDICTKCRKDMFFSHRGEKGKTGSMVAIMQLD